MGKGETVGMPVVVGVVGRVISRMVRLGGLLLGMDGKAGEEEGEGQVKCGTEQEAGYETGHETGHETGGSQWVVRLVCRWLAEHRALHCNAVASEFQWGRLAHRASGVTS